MYTCGTTVLSKITSHARIPSFCRPKDIPVLPNVTESLKVFSIWAIRCGQMALPISITGSLLLVYSYYVSVVGKLPVLICGTTLITCSVVFHTEVHNNLRLVHNTKLARYVQRFQYNAGLWQTDRRTDRHVATANTSLIRAGKMARDYATITLWYWEAANTL